MPIISETLQQSKEKGVFVYEMEPVKRTDEGFIVEEAWIERGHHLKYKRKYGLFYETEIDDYCNLIFRLKKSKHNRFGLDSMLSSNWRMSYRTNRRGIRYVGMRGDIHVMGWDDCGSKGSIVLDLSIVESDTRIYVGELVFKPKD